MNDYLPTDQQDIDRIPPEDWEDPEAFRVEEYEEWEDEQARQEEAADRAIENNHGGGVEDE